MITGNDARISQNLHIQNIFSPQLKTTFSTDSRVQNMFDILLDAEMEKDKREKVGFILNLDTK